jgi:hypothetical protein
MLRRTIALCIIIQRHVYGLIRCITCSNLDSWPQAGIPKVSESLGVVKTPSDRLGALPRFTRVVF